MMRSEASAPAEFRLPDEAVKPALDTDLARALAALAAVLQRRDGTERVPVAWRTPEAGSPFRHGVVDVSPGLVFDVLVDRVRTVLDEGRTGAGEAVLTLEAVPDGVRLLRPPEGYSDAETGRLLTRAAALADDAMRRTGTRLCDLAPETDDALPSRHWTTGPPTADTRTVPARIAAQAAERPDSPAVVCGDTVLRYGELHGRAQALAARLVAKGVRPESVVAIRADRSPELVIALLAVVSAGAAYLALDPEQPRDRIERLLGDARPALVLAASAHLAALPTGETEVLNLDDELAAADLAPVPARLPDPRPGHLAYVSYTSGSTGEPKGVAVPHLGVTRLVDPDWARFGPEDVFLQIAPVAFDASTFEIWTCLVHGATLAVYPPGRITPELLAETVQRHGVTVLSLTAGLFHQVADTAPEVFAGVRRLVAGGDVVSAQHVRDTLRAHPGLTFTHAYGPTENTTFTTVWTPDGPPPGEYLPIGRPIRGTGVVILDESLVPVPIGAVGELYTSGDGLARGYLGRPAATAERFLPDPRPGVYGARMYRTGDLARWLENGDIQFLGRADTQVKIRGYRVETGEIEARLRASQDVRDAAVLAPLGASGARELVAYLVLAGDGANPAGVAERLRRGLTEQLPPYMIPHRLYALPALPLNANGKVDRGALAGTEALELGRRPDAGPTAPGSELERLVASAWRDVLGRDTGVHENFFEAGGDSLLLLRLRARLSQLLGRKVPTVALFSHPTIRDLADHLDAEPLRPDRGPGADTPRDRQALRERARRLGAEGRGPRS
ncbi:amino acid adenylation domain-containing protein [Streptomyces arenae]|uniref:amino acid adenylation domain-containing protein n=1 Tax=Streptomyces arenae TaxID=29301 RepID=UPI002659EF2C|nr:amino acid adenylation domain-containing protein [Streptomyces arenae]MCG7204960.1 amino acid adenylation domain-containing protein [Streptomyces arenae]